ncbi:hypothetical protein [Undibacterium sp. Ji49W]|uniref:hypothetical protein n=1 Tax=Undibacterium sp. Ji49W TaxID=3413040 RepID=UPI003BEFF8C3
MGMSWIIGFNPSFPKGEQWKEVYVNSTADMYLSEFLSDALENIHPTLYEKITEQSGGHFIHFDELSKEDFRLVHGAINNLLNSPDLTDYQMECAALWHSLLSPLFQIDERN